MNHHPKIIFILPNIYECVNGVSTKYIKFIEFLKNNLYNIVVYTTFKNKDIMNDILKTQTSNFKIIKVKGLNIPFYNDIKIPTLSYQLLYDEIKYFNEIIIFNGEFIWLYDMLKKIKTKHKTIKIYPTMHTDYQFYLDNVYSKYNFLSNTSSNNLNYFLENKLFDGIIVTGKRMVDKYKLYTDAIFNANEINLNVFNSYKYDVYIGFINIIYCGRISKEKNIEEFLDCCLELYLYENKKIDFNIHIIGDGPYLNNLQSIIEIKYKKIMDKINFYGNLNPEKINELYNSLDNRVFLFTSLSETFGKTPLEAGSTGIPIFIKKSNVSDDIYIHNKNAYVFDNKKEFVELLILFIDSNQLNKQMFLNNSINNIKQYDQNIIFQNWIYFLINLKEINKNKVKINFMDVLSLFGIGKFVNCSGMLIGD